MNKKRKEYQKHYQTAYNARNKRVNLTFSKDEYALLLSAAKSQGKPLSTCAKEITLAGIQGQAIVPKNIEYELREVKFLIRNIANNVNQIAHHSNIVRDLTLADENNLLQHLKQLEDAVQRYTEGRILDFQEKSHDH